MRRRLLIPFALALALTVAVASAQDHATPLALVASPAAVVGLTGGSPTKIQWSVMPKPDGQAVDGQSLYIRGAPGAYLVTAAALMEGDVALYQCTVVIGPGGSSPPTPIVPVVPVVPTPSPAPASPPTWALAVFDTSKQISLAPGQLAIWKSQTIGPALAAVGVTYRHYDVADPAVTGSTWGIAASKLGRPALVLWRGSAVVAGYPVVLPASEADLIALVKGATSP